MVGLPKPNTNESRRLAKRQRIRDRHLNKNETPLMVLGAYRPRDGAVPADGSWLDSIAIEFIEAALAHVEQRMIFLASKIQNHRSRRRSFWLGRWALWINNQLNRRKGTA